MATRKKLTLYFPEEMLEDAKQEAMRQDRSISWILQTAWRIARAEIAAYPAVDDMIGDDGARAGVMD